MSHRSTLLLAALALTGCGQSQQLDVRDAWVRLAAVPGRPAGAYFILHGGAADATLVGIATPSARRTEMHESRMTASGGMTMDSLPQVRVPAAGDVPFQPMGRHAMLFDVDPAVKPGGTIDLTLTFADGRTVSEAARVVAAGDPAP